MSGRVEVDPLPCVCCGAAEAFVPQYRVGRHHLVRCRRCSLIRLAKMPPPQALAEIYSTERYFHNPDFLDADPDTLFGYQDADAEAELKDRLYARLLRPVLRRAFPSPAGRSWFDVGAGLGSTVKFARGEGFDAVGIEPNPTALARARAAYGDRFLSGRIEDVRIDRTFDVISVMDVVEHLLDPAACLSWIREHMAPDGIALVVTMDCRSAMSRLLGARLEDFRRVREHVYFFGRGNFRLLAQRCGLRTDTIRSWGGYFHGRRLAERVLAMAGVSARAAERMAATLVPPGVSVYVDPRVKMLVVLRRAGKVVGSAAG